MNITESKLRLLGATILFPVLIAVAVAGCDAQLTVSKSPSASGLGTVMAAFGIAVDSTTVYVTQYFLAAVQTVPVIGGPATPLGVAGADRGSVVDGERLYWNPGDAIARCDKANCADTTVIMAPGRGIVTDMAVNVTSIYWTEVTDMGSGCVMKMDKYAVAPPPADGGADAAADGGADAGVDGSAPVAVPVQIAPPHWPYNVALDATSVYWIEQGQPAGVWTAALAGGPAVRLASSDEYEPGGLALDDLNVYFADGNGTVFKAPKSGGATTVVLSNLGLFPAGLAADATNLYVAASTKIVSQPWPGVSPERWRSAWLGRAASRWPPPASTSPTTSAIRS